MPKPVAAVRFEGTIAENADPDLLDFGSLKPGALEKVKKLHDTHSILVVSATVKYPRGVKLLYLWLIEHLVDFTDVWCGEGLPSADLWVDDNAVKL
jgi:5'(3')-deoxyribonucleotidase